MAGEERRFTFRNMFKIIELPYALDALDPVISAQTLSFHHGKHLQGYVDNLNKLLPDSGLEDLSLEEIIKASLPVATSSSLPAPTGNPAIFNNAGQILNHNLYFTQFTAKPSLPAPTGNLKAQIEEQWGTLDAFKAEFEAKGTTLFGSGWVWLQANETGELSIGQYSGADNPVAHGLKPLLTFDVWEHAYYLDYQNRRAAHLKALWQIVNWAEIERRYSK